MAASEAATPRSAGLGEYALALTPIVLYGIFNVMRDTFASKVRYAGQPPQMHPPTWDPQPPSQ